MHWATVPFKRIVVLPFSWFKVVSLKQVKLCTGIVGVNEVSENTVETEVSENIVETEVSENTVKTENTLETEVSQNTVET